MYGPGKGILDMPFPFGTHYSSFTAQRVIAIVYLSLRTVSRCNCHNNLLVNVRVFTVIARRLVVIASRSDSGGVAISSSPFLCHSRFSSVIPAEFPMPVWAPPRMKMT